MITSKSNDLIKKCFQIKQKKYSRLYNLCFVESIKIVKELSQKNLVEVILVVENKFDSVKDFSANKIEIISSNIATYLSDATTSDGVFAICKIPNIDNSNYSRCLVLDRIQDPNNLGAIIRSACAFGFDTILSLNSVYPYTYKSIRSSMGNIFNVDYIDIDFEDLKLLKERFDLSFVVADMNGESIDCVKFNAKKNIAIVIGNEGQGVDERLIQLSEMSISIPMSDKVESLNASVSAGIIMYLLK